MLQDIYTDRIFTVFDLAILFVLFDLLFKHIIIRTNVFVLNVKKSDCFWFLYKIHEVMCLFVFLMYLYSLVISV